MCYSGNNNPGKILAYKIPLVGNTHPMIFFWGSGELLNFCLGSIHISGRQVGRRYVAYSRDKPVITYLQFFPDDGEHYPGVCYWAEVTLFLKALGRLYGWALHCPFTHSVIRVWGQEWYLKGSHYRVLWCVRFWAEQSLILTYLQKVCRSKCSTK